MKEFLKDTKESIEQLYGSVICQKFPMYSTFWNKFIGGKAINGIPCSYGLVIPNSLKSKVQIDETYTEISHTHYTLFCHLAGAHFQLENLKSSLKITDDRKRYFEHWEYFDVFYMHLGIVMYQIYHLWGLVFLLEGVIVRDENGDFRDSRKSLKKFLREENKKLLDELESIDDEVKILRDNITHYMRTAFYPTRSGYAIPCKITKNMNWKECYKKPPYIETHFKTKSDLMHIESFLDKLHALLFKKFEDYLFKNKIKVDY